VILDQLLDYIRFDDTDRARLVGLHAKLEPWFPDIAERFYEAVWRSPAAAVLSGPEQTERLRITLIDWMSTGLLGPYDRAFNEKRRRIGKRHVEIGLAQHYMFTAMNVVRTAYIDHIGKLYPADEAVLVIRSVAKLFDIELALMLRHYQLDSEEKMLSRERAMLADRIRALQTMTAGLAHEVRNPLNAAKLQLELLERRLRRKTEDASKLTEPAELASHEIARLADLLDDFLAFARAPELHRSQQDIVAVARHVIELERPFAERSDTRLELTNDGAPIMASVDPGKLHQIVQNLVRNALEATPRGRVTVTISEEIGRFHVRVSDDGPGIPDDIRHRIYEPFFSTKEGGTGMGMAIVHNFVTMHGGTIELASTGRGTSIDVAMPR
jgi:signal transduction histidine kinase